MRTGSTYLKFHFIILGAMAAIAQLPIVVFVAMLYTVGVGFVLLAGAATILVYSLALLPLWFAITDRPRSWLRIGGATLVPIILALALPAFSHIGANRFIESVRGADFAKESAVKPKSIEIVGDQLSGVFAYSHGVGDKSAECSEICRNLLFNHEVDRVRMTKVLKPVKHLSPAPPRSVTFRLERRDFCPQVYQDGLWVDQAFGDRLVAGDCLIAGDESGSPIDATINFTTWYDWQHDPAPPEHAPALATIRRVKRLAIERRIEGGATEPLMLRTETTVDTLSIPFYFDYGFSFFEGEGYNGQTIGRSRQVINAIDLAQALRDTFGFKVAPVEPPAQQSVPSADQILTLPQERVPSFSPPQQDFIKDAVLALKMKPSLSDDDVALLRRVIADPRITERHVGAAVLDVFRRHHARLEQLVPVTFERLRWLRGTGRGWSYHEMLTWVVADYATEVLLPYRDQIVAIVEDYDDITSTGLLMRVGELGMDTSDLIIRRLAADSGELRQFAAVAACRSPDNIWVQVEAAALAHLEAVRSRRFLLYDQNPLMLALIRHGKMDVVTDFIDKSQLQNKVQIKTWLSRYEPGFSPDRCRDLW